MNTLDFKPILWELDTRFALNAGKNHDLEKLYAEAATAIRWLLSDLKDCRNELCLRCGNYKEAHKGACDDCRWKDMGD